MSAHEAKFDPEDPRLTAYALGELEEGPRAEVEALLASSAEARAFVAEVRDTAAQLAAELAAEPAQGLSAAQRARIERELGRKRTPWYRRPALRVAALVALVLVPSAALVWSRVERERASTAPFTYSVFGEPLARFETPGAASQPEASARPRASRPAMVPAETRAIADGRPTAGPASPGPSGAVLPAREALRSLGYVDGSRVTPDSIYVQRLDDVAHDTEAYDALVENPFQRTADEPRSTFSIDVDTASYSNVRRMLLGEGRLPPPGSVRIEELVNYFRYDYPAPDEGLPFSITAEVAGCPWAPNHRLVKLGLRAPEIAAGQRPAANLVFLIDVSGSMQPANKLPLLLRGMQMLVETLDERDSVAIAVYAGASGLVLPPTSCAQKETILAALERLSAGGSTNGGEGIRLAYDVARKAFVAGGVNRVILATDGDFNVGTTDESSLVRLIEEERKSGVFLSVLGFGGGNYKDATLEKLADHGNGNYAYVDSLDEARKVLVEEMGATLIAVAKDVKLQVELNPAETSAWRLIGYENRVLAHQDFNDDTKDAGEIGAGHTVTALYEVVPHWIEPGIEPGVPAVDPLKYQRPLAPTGAAQSGELMTLKLRYKQPAGDTSALLERVVVDAGTGFFGASPDLQFAAAVAGFGMLLRGSPHAGNLSYDTVLELAQGALGDDRSGRRTAFLELVRKARDLQPRQPMGRVR